MRLARLLAAASSPTLLLWMFMDWSADQHDSLQYSICQFAQIAQDCTIVLCKTDQICNNIRLLAHVTHQPYQKPTLKCIAKQGERHNQTHVLYMASKQSDTLDGTCSCFDNQRIQERGCVRFTSSRKRHKPGTSFCSYKERRSARSA